MKIKNTRHQLKDKHEYLQYLLLKRCEIELKEDEYADATLVAHNLFWLYPKDEQAHKTLIQLYVTSVEKLIDDKKMADAEKLVAHALQLDPKNKNISSLSKIIDEKKTEIKKIFLIEKTREVASNFIEKYYPGELNLFDIAWRVFKDIVPKDVRREAFSENLGITGAEKVTLFTPDVVIILTALSKEPSASLTEDRVVQRITEVGKQIGSSEDLINQLNQYVLESFKNYLP